jgi:Ser/Thr protein kinase RdoA (MazF antagonist)
MPPSDSQLEEVRSRWGLAGEIRFLRRVANFVYASSLDGRPVIVRLTEPSHRRRGELEAELEWMGHLSGQGVRLARPIPSRGGALVEEIPGEPAFHAAAFEWAEGSALSGKQIDARALESWGAYLGRMHKATRLYLPAKPGAARADWQGDDIYRSAAKSLNSNDRPAYDRMNELTAWLRGLPRPEDAYGLVHADLHRGNFFVGPEGITAFDFDDSCRHWFVYDLTAPLFSILNAAEDEGMTLEKGAARDRFLAGYASENALSPEWMARLDAFMIYRAALVYLWIKTGLTDGIFDEKGRDWCRRRTPELRELLRPPLQLS